MTPNDSHPLDYQSPQPQRPSWRRFAARWLGVGLLLLGVPFLLRGIISLAQLFGGLNRFARSGHAEQNMICLLIAAVCLIIGIGWMRHGFARTDDA